MSESQTSSPEPTTESVETQEQSIASRPEYVPEKFWDAEKGEARLQTFGESYTQLEQKFHSKMDDLRAEVKAEGLANRPENSSDYTLPELEGVEFQDGDPLLSFWREQAHGMGLDNAGFQAGIQNYVEAMQANAPNIDQELAKLGEDGQTRIDAINAWADAKLSEDTKNALNMLATTAEGVVAIEEMMSLSQSSANNVDGASSTPVAETLEELQALMNTEKYWGAAGVRDDQLVDRVTKGFERLQNG